MIVIRDRGLVTGELPRFENSRNVEMTESVGDQQEVNTKGRPIGLSNKKIEYHCLLKDKLERIKDKG